jgi:O-antigen/teichoic acid export membrane protein
MVGLFTDNLLIGSILGAEMVTVFFLTQRLITIASTQVGSISTASWAALVDLHLKGEQKTFETRVLELTMVATAFGTVAFVPLVAFNRAFIGLWIGHASYAGEAVTILSAVNGLAMAVLALWISLFDGTAQSRRLVPMSITSAAVNIAVSTGATFLVGLPGPLIGTAVALLGIQVLWIPFLLRRYFHLPVRGLFASIARPLALAIPFGLLLKLWAIHHEPRSWIQLGASLASAAMILACLIWALLLNAHQRSMWTHRVRIILGR